MARLHALALVLFAACGPQVPSVIDGGSGDDAGCVGDCASDDAGEADASVAPGDAGTETADAGELVDAGEFVDAGAVDAGAVDAGCPWDCGANEVCVPDQRQCVCADGFHACNGSCVPDDAPTSCGGRCTPCPSSIANASGACVDGQCSDGWVCNPGFHRCGDACLPDDSVASCGSRCEPCSAAPDARAVCIAGQCEISCNPGFELCEGICARCPSGSTSTACDGARCVATACGSGTLACEGACSACPPHAMGTACDGTTCIATSCGAGMLACSGVCAECPAYATATACDGAACVATACDTGTLLCAGRCAECSSTGATSTRCEGERCVHATCAAGYHLCGEVCLPDDSVDSCGSRCEPCLTGGQGTASCVAGQCELSCEPGRLACGDRCAWCLTSDAVASLGCNFLGNLCGPTACKPGYYLCSHGCCPDRFQTYEAVGIYSVGPDFAYAFDLDSGDLPHVVWLEPSSAGGYTMNHAVRTPAGWQKNVLVQSGAFGPVFIELDGTDTPHVLYKNSAESKYATRVNDAWVHESIGTGLGWPRLAVDPLGNPAVLAVRAGRVLMLRRAQQGWSEEEIAPRAEGLAGLALAFDLSGAPHVLFADTSTGVYRPIYATRGPSGWRLEQVTQLAGYPYALAVASNGSVTATFIASGVLMHATRAADASWTSEVITVLSSSGSAIGTMAISSTGRPYVGMPPPFIGYATRESGGWALHEAEGWDGYSTTLVRLDSADRVHLLYSGWDFENWSGPLQPALVWAH